MPRKHRKYIQRGTAPDDRIMLDSWGDNIAMVEGYYVPARIVGFSNSRVIVAAWDKTTRAWSNVLFRIKCENVLAAAKPLPWQRPLRRLPKPLRVVDAD